MTVLQTVPPKLKRIMETRVFIYISKTYHCIKIWHAFAIFVSFSRHLVIMLKFRVVSISFWKASKRSLNCISVVYSYKWRIIVSVNRKAPEYFKTDRRTASSKKGSASFLLSWTRWILHTDAIIGIKILKIVVYQFKRNEVSTSKFIRNVIW